MNEIFIYQNEDNMVQVEVRLEDETVWLTQPQIVALFDSSKANISEHIRHIIDSGELDAESTVRKLRTVQAEGSRRVSRERPCYNLDMIISIGYRVNSKRGTQFRIWANNVLKDYLMKGYALNEKRLSERERELCALKRSIQLLERTVTNQAQQLDQAKVLVGIIADFSIGLGILDDFDNEKLDSSGFTVKEAAVISYEECKNIIGQIKDEFNSPLFGKEKDGSFKSSIGQIYQSFAERPLYPSIEEKAAMLLYLVVKNHSFVDGNKRIAATIFLYFLNKNGVLYHEDKTTLIDGNTLASITLMIAESNPGEMETVKRIVISILNRSNKH